MADDNVKPSGFRPFFWGHIDNGEEMNWHEDWGMKIFPQFANFELVMDHIIWKARPPTRIRSVLQSWRAIKGGGGDWKKRSCENGPANYRHWRYILIWCTLQKRWNDLRNWNIALHMSILARSRKYQIAHQYDFFIIVLELSVSRQLL